MKIKNVTLLVLTAIVFSITSCEIFDKHVKPDIQFKTGTGYTSTDVSVVKGSTIKVGIKADKTEDAMKTFNVSYSFDGTTTTTTKDTFTLSGDQETHYDKDYEFTVRNQAGKEQWFFTITDRDGNIAQLSVTLTVTEN